ncbi:MAG: DUF262 domain-containing protein [Nitrospira sp.]
MNDWPFVEGKKIIGLQMLELIDWVDKSWPASSDLLETDGKPLFALPPLQRDAVWRPKQVVDLWDSVMRGLPIGILYLIWQPEGAVRDVVDKAGKTIKRKKGGYDLLDGQQRIRALLLGAVGFSEEKRCLWVDLGDNTATRGFGLRISSKGQPFGYDSKTGAKLNIRDRKTAREELEVNGEVFCKDPTGEWREAYDHELFDGEVIQGGNPLSPQPPLPYGHSKYIYKLSDLLDAWRWREGSAHCGDKDRFTALKAMVGNGPTEEALVGLHEAFKRIKEGEVALLRVDPQSFREGGEDLLELFQRIGAGGAPLSVEERLYSIYKHRCPYIRDAVNEIYNQIGRVLSPTKIASTAIRIAYAQAHADRNYMPDIAAFSKAMVDPNEKNFRDILSTLIPEAGLESEGEGTLLDGFLSLEYLLRRERDHGHFWIPEVMLSSLPTELWQVLVFWAVGHRNTANLEISRQEAVRFALFWYLAVKNNEKAARSSFAYIKMNKETLDFPGKDLYKLLTDTGNWDSHCAYKLAPPKDLKDKLCSKDGFFRWRTEAERFVENGTRNELAYQWWCNGKKLLPWLQKEYIHDNFRDYVPLTDHEDDVPYDIDHICPTKDWGGDDWRNLQGRLPNIEKNRAERDFREGRWTVGGSIGNLQLLASSENRKYQDVDVAAKMSFIERDNHPPSEADSKNMADFAFAPEHRGLWRKVSRSGPVADRRWDEDRLKSFQDAVEQRATWLYQRFHDDLGFEPWTKRE